MKGTDQLRDLGIKEGNAQMDVQEIPCVCGLNCSGSVYVSVADTHERGTELLVYIKVINLIDKLSSN